ncbi:hypothetical protein ACS74_09505 [Exiguobacterium acetylicum]|nr:hypothetical protein ACS74_09505 [Exiguobacterium acetylicum]
MVVFNLFKRDYTIQYQVLRNEKVMDTDRLTIRAGNHTIARKKADDTLRKEFGRTKYKIEWVQRF